MILLGSTGSIGVNTLKIAKEFNLEVEGLVAGNNYKLLNQQIEEFNPKYVVVKDKETARNINFKNVKYSQEAILDVIEQAKSDIVVNALVGEAGLKPTLKANECKKKLALANKESLVIAGKFVDTSNLTPIDSEHFGLWYMINNREIKKMTITASGGALRDFDIDKLHTATLDEVLKHPNWSMGVKITIDSATMVNKLFEVLEAKWLFNISNIDAIIEISSTIHSMIDFIDGSTVAHIAKPDMRLPIAYALLNRVDKEIVSHIDFNKLSKLEFRNIDTKRYPIWQIKDEVLKNPDLGVVINTANEIAIHKFINKEINFMEISKIILDTINKYHNIKIKVLEDIWEIQKEIKNFLVQ
jgi:1-deoxy-D-xylulose-5-phosphate reductoisomerase